MQQVLAIEAGLVHALHRAAQAADPRSAGLEALAHYLDPTQRENVASNCPLVAHPVDAIRGDTSRKDGYTQRLTSVIEATQAVLDDDRSLDEATLIAVLAIGGRLLSAASSDPLLADRIEAVCLDVISSILNPRTHD